MAQRSTPLWKQAERIYPVRLKFITPVGGYGVAIMDMIEWLIEHCGRDDYLWHASTLYLRSADLGARFMQTFPQLKLDDRALPVR
jgi:hypothetical protein